MEGLRRRVAVVMQRRSIDNRWQTEVWEPLGVLPDTGEPAHKLVERPGLAQWLYPGFDISLTRSEAEGYFHNMSTADPRIFVLWRLDERGAVPHFVTASYDEASRWMDGGENVDSVPMPAELQAWVRAFVEQNYRPEPKKRIKPQSFLSPKDRART